MSGNESTGFDEGTEGRVNRGRRSKQILFIVVVVGVLLVSSVVVQGVIFDDGVGSDERQIEFLSDGEVVATASVEVASTQSEMETGLSDHQSLDDGEGMLFAHQSEEKVTYGMPDMDFGIDIVFLTSDCEVDSIKSADQPEDGETGVEPHHQYTGEGKYVVEVPQGFATNSVSPGDEVSFQGGCS